MTKRVPRRASAKAMILSSLLILLAAIPLNAADEVATSDDPTTDWGQTIQTADSTGTEPTESNEGNPTDIDQIVDVVLSWIGAVKAWGR